MQTSFPLLLPGLLCPVLGLAFFVFVVFVIIRAVTRRGSRPLQTSRTNVLTQMADDGFWIVSCAAQPDAMIHYHYWANGVRYAGQIPFQPGPDGRQFVYTGMRPEQAAIIRILQTDDDAGSSLLPPVFTSAGFLPGSDEPDSSPAPPTTSSFPSAY
jgi:hypothetical protein